MTVMSNLSFQVV